jgi:hypothetical protein
MRAADLTGSTFSRLTVMRRTIERSVQARWICKCICGGEKVVITAHLRKGGVRSCGCLRDERKPRLTHGFSYRSEYFSWNNARMRCFNKNSESYPLYGGRGITMCEEWRSNFAAFLAHIGPKPSSKHSIDRIDTNGHYEPGNVRWATAKQQAANRRKAKCREHVCT